MKNILLLASLALFSCNEEQKNTGLRKEESKVTDSTEIKMQAFIQDSIEQSGLSYKIERISGKHKYGGVTKIEYSSLCDILNGSIKTAKKDMWTSQKLKDNIDAYKSICKGGQILLYIERSTIGSANMEMYSVIIKDTTEKEIYRVNMDNESPDYSDGSWWNQEFVYIGNRIKPPFYVYVVDRLEDAPFKFKVYPVKKVAAK